MKRNPGTVRNTVDQEDMIAMHGHLRGIKARATMMQIAYDKGVEALEAQLPENWRDLLEASRKEREGER